MLNEPQVNILLVDDHPENLIALEAILEGLGQNLVKAKSGIEALKCLLNQDFAVILLDVQMPVMDGFETAALIRQRERSRQTPIIFLTAFNTSDSFVFKGYSLKAVDYLLKPIEPETLLSKVEVFVELHQTTAALQRQTAHLIATNAQLKRSEELFRSLSACSPIGIFLTDLEGRFTYTNPRCQEICGFSLEESLSNEWANFIHPEDRAQVLAEWSHSLNQQQGHAIEYRIQLNSGLIRWVNVRFAPMSSGTRELVGYVGTVEDVSEAKRNEAVRKQAEEAQFQLMREQVARQEAEAMNRMKDEFLAVLSHELRTPLNSIVGWAKLLRMRQLDAEKTTRALETIERNAQLQTDLIADILDVSRIIQGKLQLNCAALTLAPIIETILDAMRPLAAAKSIQIDSSLNSAVEPVWVDANRLQQMVGNLLSNAIKFTPADGKVELRLEQVESYAQIQVIDTGIGIAADFLPHIFDRFRQADSSTTREAGGLGLGLAIVRHLVELHKGSIAATSNGEGQGAIFTIRLPLADAQAAKLAEVSPDLEHEPLAPPFATLEQIHPLKGLQILVVEDEPDARDFLQFLLEESGAEVTSAASASTGLAAIAQHPPHLLISDIGMAEEDGYSFIRKVRKSQFSPDIPAIALTAYAREVDQQRSIEAGFQVHLTKPFKPSELIAAIVKLMQGDF